MATYSGANAVPTDIRVNGQACGGAVPPVPPNPNPQPGRPPRPIPGQVEAEDYDQMQGIDTESCSEGGKSVGYQEVGDWFEFQIEVASDGSYDFEFRVASQEASGAFDLLFDGQRLASLQVPNTGAWQSWTSLSTQVSLRAGVHTLRLLTIGKLWNLNWFKAVKGSGVPNPNPNPNPNPGQGFVGQHGRLRVQGSQLVDQAGLPIQLKGMSSHGLQWYGHFMNAGSLKWLRDNWGMFVKQHMR